MSSRVIFLVGFLLILASLKVTFLGVLLFDNISIILSPAFLPTCSPVFVAAVVIALIAAVLAAFKISLSFQITSNQKI